MCATLLSPCVLLNPLENQWRPSFCNINCCSFVYISSSMMWRWLTLHQLSALPPSLCKPWWGQLCFLFFLSDPFSTVGHSQIYPPPSLHHQRRIFHSLGPITQRVTSGVLEQSQSDEARMSPHPLCDWPPLRDTALEADCALHMGAVRHPARIGEGKSRLSYCLGIYLTSAIIKYSPPQHSIQPPTVISGQIHVYLCVWSL